MREEVEFEWDEDWEAYRIKRAEGVEELELDPRAYYSPEEYRKLVAELKREREEYISRL